MGLARGLVAALASMGADRVGRRAGLLVLARLGLGAEVTSGSAEPRRFSRWLACLHLPAEITDKLVRNWCGSDIF